MTESNGQDARGSYPSEGATPVAGAADDPRGAVPKASIPRLARWHALPLTERRQAQRRLAAAGRQVIEALVSTNAPTERLADLAAQTEALASELGHYGTVEAYSGFAEAANAGEALERFRAAVASGDPEAFAFFDASPFIGLSNPLAPPVTLRYSDDSVEGEVRFGSAYEGPPGCVHGGYIAAVFDELLGATQSLSGTQGMTANLTVDYRRPTPLHSTLVLEGTLVSFEGRKIVTRGVIRHDGEVTAEAQGLFIAMSPEMFGSLVDRRDQRQGQR